jgi:glycerophosphoryl diester phosphodiesterase
MIYVVGHRGAGGVMPENTLKGFTYALELGVDYVECDIHLTRDHELVVIHDATVNRTTNGTGAVGAMSLARIRRLDAGQGERVPTLDEVLETVRGRGLLLLELKGMGVERAAVAAVAAHGMADDVTFTSFEPARLAVVRDLGRQYRIGAIFPNPTEFDLARAAELSATRIDVHYRHLNLRMLEEAHAKGLEVLAWNPDTWREQRAMLALGADGVSSNRPDILLANLQQVAAGEDDFAW